MVLGCRITLQNYQRQNLLLSVIRRTFLLEKLKSCLVLCSLSPSDSLIAMACIYGASESIVLFDSFIDSL